MQLQSPWLWYKNLRTFQTFLIVDERAFGGPMKGYLPLLLVVPTFFCAAAPSVCKADEIPKTAWRRPLGAPLANPGVRKNKSDIDDGY